MAQWLADFVDPSPAVADYHLKSTSLSNNAASDGKDIGVDYAELMAVLNVNGTQGSTTTPDPPPEPDARAHDRRHESLQRHRAFTARQG